VILQHNKANPLGQTKSAPLVPRYAYFVCRWFATLCVFASRLRNNYNV